jgi:hypothetical protein
MNECEGGGGGGGGQAFGEKKNPYFFRFGLTPLLLLLLLLDTFGRIDRRALSHEISSACQIIISNGGRRERGGV